MIFLFKQCLVLNMLLILKRLCSKILKKSDKVNAIGMINLCILIKDSYFWKYLNIIRKY